MVFAIIALALSLASLACTTYAVRTARAMASRGGTERFDADAFAADLQRRLRGPRYCGACNHLITEDERRGAACVWCIDGDPCPVGTTLTIAEVAARIIDAIANDTKACPTWVALPTANGDALVRPRQHRCDRARVR